MFDINKNINNGYIWLNRNIIYWEYMNEPTVVVVFITLLLLANHREQVVDGITVERGATIVSIRRLSEITGLSRSTIFKALKKLVASGEIERVSVLKNQMKNRLLNYSKYQRVSLGNAENGILKNEPKQEYIYKNKKSSSLSSNKITHAYMKMLTDILDSGVLVEQFCMKDVRKAACFIKNAKNKVFFGCNRDIISNFVQNINSKIKSI